MSIETLLGLGEGDQALRAAEQAWPAWCASEPALPAEVSLRDLRGWLLVHRTDYERVDQVLWTLARMAARSGGDSVLAASVLAWLLIPGASHMAGQLGPGLAEDLAMQLWIGCRTFPWENRRHAIAANVLLDARREIRQTNDMSDRTVLVDPGEQWWQDVSPPPPASTHARLRLVNLLGLARDSGRVTESDISLVVMLAEAAPTPGARRSEAQGMLAREVSDQVGAQLGRCGRTVRRRARRTLDTLNQVAVAAGVEAA